MIMSLSLNFNLNDFRQFCARLFYYLICSPPIIFITITIISLLLLLSSTKSLYSFGMTQFSE